MKTSTAALFDLDGVLVDTETIYTQIWSDIESTHPTGIENFALKIKGTTLPGILNTYFPDPDVQADVCRQLYAYEDAMQYIIFDGVLEFLEDLRAHSIPAAIVTSSGTKKMEKLFAAHPGFRSYFAEVLTDADVTHSKPHPEGYMKAAARLGVPSENAIVFEDSYAGLQAGRAAGGKVVALATTNPRHTLTDKADVVLDSFVGLSVDGLLNLLLQE